LIVVSAAPSSSVTCCAAPSSVTAPSLPPKSILTRLRHLGYFPQPHSLDQIAVQRMTRMSLDSRVLQLVVREPYTGAWQQNADSARDVL